MSDCCNSSGAETMAVYETVRIRKTTNTCTNCEDYVNKNAEKPIAVVSCEGACLRGEISRRVANVLCHELSPENTVRICQGSAVTKDAGQRQLIKNAKQVLILEGCTVQCASRLLDQFPTQAAPDVVFTDRYAVFDSNLFGSNELSSNQIDEIAVDAAQVIYQKYIVKA